MSRFSLNAVDEVHLEHAPLAKVLMQVQYSRTPELVTDASEALIAEALHRYPVRRRQFVTNASVALNGQPIQLGPAAASGGTVLLYSDLSGLWQVTITDTSASLETTEYDSRDDFCTRSLEVFQAIVAVALPPVVDRAGLRYINRLAGEQLSLIPQFVIPQLQVLYGSVESPLILSHSVSDSVIEITPGERLQVRSGLLPAGAGFDPSLPAISEPSWVLDMDVYTTQGGFGFAADELTGRLRRYAEIEYAFFRFATTAAFGDDRAGEPVEAGREVK